MSRQWDPTPKARVSTLRPFGGEILPIEPSDVRYFTQHYEVDGDVSLKYIRLSPTTNRYILPIIAPEGWVRGMVLRKPWPEAPRTAIEPYFDLPKADTFMSRYEPVQSFYKAEFGDHDHMVIVEDQLSAIKLATYGHDSVAVLGTPYSKGLHFAQSDRVAELARESNGRETVVAFDADATESAFEFVRKWGPSFRRIRVAILTADLKDTSHWDFGRILGV